GHLPVAERLALDGAVRHAQRDGRGARAPGLARLLRGGLVAARLASAVGANPWLASPVLEADDGGHLHFLGAAVGVGERPEEVRVPRHRLERRNGGPVAAGLL